MTLRETDMTTTNISEYIKTVDASNAGDLVATLFDAVTVPGMKPGDAAREIVEGLNADLGTAHDIKRLGQWRRGERAIPQPVQDWMLRACIAHAITQCGGVAPTTDTDLDRLAKMLFPPAR